MDPIRDSEIQVLLESDGQCLAEVRIALAKFEKRRAKISALQNRGYARPGPKVPAPIVESADYVAGAAGTIAVGKAFDPLESIVWRATPAGAVIWFVDDAMPAQAVKQEIPPDTDSALGPFYEGASGWEGAKWELDQALEAHRKGAPEGEIVCRMGWYYCGARYFTSRASAYNYRRDHR